MCLGDARKFPVASRTRFSHSKICKHWGLRFRSLRRIANAKLSIRNEGAFGSPARAARGERLVSPSPQAPTSMPSEALMDAISGNKGKQYRIRHMNGDVNRIRSVGAESWKAERLLENMLFLR